MPLVVVTSLAAGGRRRRFDRRRPSSRAALWGLVFIGPSLLIFLAFFAYPLFLSLLRSFETGQPGSTTFAGIANYLVLIGDKTFWRAVWNTILYTTVVVVFGLVISVGLAALIYPLGSRLQAIFKGAFYLPTVVSAVVVTLIWGWMYHPAYGILNYIVGLAGGDPVPWLGDTTTAMPAVMAMAIATGRGVGIVLITASMATVPPELYEAAKMDGAAGWQLFRRITIPLIKPVLLYLTLISVIEAFQVFTPIYVLTNGGPDRSTITVAFSIYRSAFSAFDLGMAAAQSMVLLLLLLPFSYFCFRVFGRDVEF